MFVRSMYIASSLPICSLHPTFTTYTCFIVYLYRTHCVPIYYIRNIFPVNSLNTLHILPINWTSTTYSCTNTYTYSPCTGRTVVELLGPPKATGREPSGWGVGCAWWSLLMYTYTYKHNLYTICIHTTHTHILCIYIYTLYNIHIYIYTPYIDNMYCICLYISIRVAELLWILCIVQGEGWWTGHHKAPGQSPWSLSCTRWLTMGFLQTWRSYHRKNTLHEENYGKLNCGKLMENHS